MSSLSFCHLSQQLSVQISFKKPLISFNCHGVDERATKRGTDAEENDQQVAARKIT